MRTLVFDICGEYGLFKKPYSPMSPVSYPLPPPPAVLGMLGAVLGLDKADYHNRLGWDRVRIGVGLRAPVRVFRAALNLLQTKDGTDAFFRPRAGQNIHTQVPCELLRAPGFRIHVAGLDVALADELAARLRAGRTAYTVTLGLASCLADLHWVGEWDAEPITGEAWQASTAVPLGAGLQVHYEESRRYHRLRIPAVMDAERTVHRYQEIVLTEDGQPIRGQGGTGVLHAIGPDIIAFL
ncbi:CRISPR-associated protein Cas5, Hmari subtype [Thiorhodococcus drewsii AZ1]|uniref:CRISPR-associated protein Cas5, Hmari subtype n=1 Tax=Thiorhodococcus drewsii AZ1 TaxID=765913 RepID=G2DYJ6_9GAMM|nr:type I-B CRISPR-associated protein Cas5b [Thiorhodococcus drewsii]EGV32623.1 CRISPR-associated protein Cas5, Hmari subtype [Thiorhodococcus drewsii AZ1]